jgi:hypothetical protein
VDGPGHQPYVPGGGDEGCTADPTLSAGLLSVVRLADGAYELAQI